VADNRPEKFLSINDVCDLYGVSRSTLYRMLRNPKSGLRDLVVRVPPGTGRIRIPARGFLELLEGRR
jgi:hypothetical protein